MTVRYYCRKGRLMPTYTCQRAGIQRPDHVTGHNIVPLLKDPNAKWNYPAITTHGRGNHAIRSARWRYIRYAQGSKGEELYDLEQDPDELHNLVAERDHAQLLAACRADLLGELRRTHAPFIDSMPPLK